VLLDAAGELNLLDLNDDLLFLGLLLALVTLEAELAVIDGTANGGCGVRNDENEINVVAVRISACIVDLHDTDLLVVFTDYANLGCFDLLVDQKILRVVGTNGSVPPKRKNAYRSLRTHLLHFPIIPNNRKDRYEPYAPLWHGENGSLLVLRRYYSTSAVLCQGVLKSFSVFRKISCFHKNGRIFL